MEWNNVLVYADGRKESQLALEEVISWVETSGGRATALDVVHYLPARIPAGLLAAQHVELLALMMQQRREQLEEDVERLRVTAQVEVRVTHGTPAFELIRRAVGGKHDLIVKAARGRDVKHMTSFGSTALHLVRKSPVPVLLMSPDQRLLSSPKVLCALELDQLDAKQALNRALLRAATGLASAYAAELHVVHVLDTSRASVYRTFLSPDLFERFYSEREQLLASELTALLASELPQASHIHAHLLEGDPADTLVEFIREQRVSHLVMGSVAHQVRGSLVGSLAEEVLTRVDCSVLTLKPPGFTTPIELDIPSAA